jgi:hypothetical protein
MNAPPLATFVSGRTLQNNNPLPIAIPDGGSVVLPRRDISLAYNTLILAGYNTCALVVTIADMVAGNTFKATLNTVDPETGDVLVGGLGDLELISETANGSYAGQVYLPAYYATITGLVLPFDLGLLTLSNTGGHAGNMHVTAVKLWLTYA